MNLWPHFAFVEPRNLCRFGSMKSTSNPRIYNGWSIAAKFVVTTWKESLLRLGLPVLVRMAIQLGETEVTTQSQMVLQLLSLQTDAGTWSL